VLTRPLGLLGLPGMPVLPGVWRLAGSELAGLAVDLAGPVGLVQRLAVRGRRPRPGGFPEPGQVAQPGRD